MADLSVNIGSLMMSNPVMTASGTFGYGKEFEDFVDLEKIGGIIVKGTTLHHREGNPYPRMAETPMGMLNAVGLQNKGVNYFVEHIYPQIKDINTNMIVNVSGSAVEDYAKTAEIINELDKIPAIELNISCPNVKQGGMAFGVSAKGCSEVVKAVREVYKKTLIVKLSPNVTDITEIARAAEASGADSVSLINTLLGMAIDAEKRRPVLSTITGGMSGAAVKPIALRMVWQVAKAVNIPVIGLGGIMDWKDAVEFMLAGATAIQIGTANFIDPAVTVKVSEGINDYLERHEAEEGVVIAYGSMYGNTEEVAEAIAEELSKQGIRNIVMHNVSHTSHSFIIADVFKYKGLIVGCPTYNTQMYPEMEALLSKLASREIKGRYLGYFGSFTWASAAVKKIAEFNDKLKFEPVGNPVEMKHSMKAETNTQAKELAKAMADRLKADRK